jgi:hypothetical protein
MAVHKLILEEDPSLNFKIFALHTVVEDYKMAYLLNKTLAINLKRTRNDFITKVNDSVLAFPIFEYQNTYTLENYCLAPNRIQTEIFESQKSQNLFLNTTVTEQQNHYLIPEYKKVDYVLKIDGISDSSKINNILFKIKKVKQINSVYQVKTNSIKTNTIFQL